MRLGTANIVLAATLAACAATQPVTTPPAEVSGSAVERRPLETPAIPPAAQVPKASSSAASLPPEIVVPANTQYVCVVNSKNGQQQTAIEFAPKVAALCRTHPEMGPCQYERNHCRSSGGRVFAANGAEITMATEAEYDKKVMRVRFRSN